MLFSATNHAKEALQKALACCDNAWKLAEHSKDIVFDLDRVFQELKKAERYICEAENEDRFATVEHQGKAYDVERAKARVFFIQGSVATHPNMPDDTMQKGVGVLERLVAGNPRDAEANQALAEAKKRSEYRSKGLATVELSDGYSGYGLERFNASLPVAVDVKKKEDELSASDWVAIVVCGIFLMFALGSKSSGGSSYSSDDGADYTPYSDQTYTPPRQYVPPQRQTYAPPPQRYYPPPDYGYQPYYRQDPYREGDGY